MSAASGRVHEDDRGMHAVARVRGVRERDSRIGLQQALREQAGREARLAGLHRHVEQAPALAAGSPAALLAGRQALWVLGEVVVEARAEADAGRRVTDAAREHWQRDRTRLRAVETLLEARAAERAAERVRRDTARLDEAAAQLWLRRRVDDHPRGPR